MSCTFSNHNLRDVDLFLLWRARHFKLSILHLRLDEHIQRTSVSRPPNDSQSLSSSTTTRSCLISKPKAPFLHKAFPRSESAFRLGFQSPNLVPGTVFQNLVIVHGKSKLPRVRRVCFIDEHLTREVVSLFAVFDNSWDRRRGKLIEDLLFEEERVDLRVSFGEGATARAKISWKMMPSSLSSSYIYIYVCVCVCVCVVIYTWV